MKQPKDSQPSSLLNVPISVVKDHCNGGFLGPNIDAKYEKFANEVDQWYTGPVPANDFLLAFVPPIPGDVEALDCALLKELFSKDADYNKQDIIEGLVSD